VTLGSGDQNHAVTLLSIPGIAISDIEGIRYHPGYPISGRLLLTGQSSFAIPPRIGRGRRRAARFLPHWSEIRRTAGFVGSIADKGRMPYVIKYLHDRICGRSVPPNRVLGYFRGHHRPPSPTFCLNRQHTKAFAGNLAVTLVSGTDTKYCDM
jgi:hypothetical protein